MKKILTFLMIIGFVWNTQIQAQVSISTTCNDPDASAMLDVQSSSLGLLPPRIADTTAVNSPAEGLLIYDLSTHCMRYYNGTKWSDCMGCCSSTPSFSCGGTVVDSRDGQSYSTVQIGTQCWMAENINVGTMISGANDQTDNGIIEKYCYGNDIANCDTYGGLYQWGEAMQYDTISSTPDVCPDGWHIPSDDEWKTLEMYLGMSQSDADALGWRGTDEGGKLKETGTTHWNSPNTGATNSSGFTGLPGGYRATSGSFDYISVYGYYWTSTEYVSNHSKLRTLGSNYSQVYRENGWNPNGFGVRCIKD